MVGRRFGAFPVADLTAVLVVRSCHGLSPQDRPGGCSDFSIGVVLEMRKEGWNYLKSAKVLYRHHFVWFLSKWFAPWPLSLLLSVLAKSNMVLVV